MSLIWKQPGRRRSERGSIIIMTAIFMLLLLLMVGLCIDVSRIYMVRAELQNAADAAALSAARELNSGTGGIDDAVAQANGIVNTRANGQRVVSMATVEFAINLDGPYMGASAAKAPATVSKIRFVKVTTQSTSTKILFALNALGASHAEARQAVAGMSVAINNICDFFPVAVALINPNPAPNTTMTLNFVQGTGNSATLRDKDFIILEVPDINGNGAPETAVLSAGVTNICQTINADITFHMTPSANINNGPTQITDGTNTRFDIRANGYGNALKDATKFPPDSNIRGPISFDQYKNRTAVTAPTLNPPGQDDRRILLVPIVALATSPTTYSPPRTPVAKFGAFFMTNRIANPQNPCSQAGHICGQLQVEWIDENLVIGRGHHLPGGAPTSLTLPVLYK